jgi:Ca-activated chloride channel family protein
LSDGLANEGITEPSTLQEIVQKKFREEGIALSTFGVGADFNEDLMTNLAEYGGGNYYFIDNPDKIPEIFAKELQGLLAVVSQNNQLEVEFNSEFFKFTSSYGLPANVQSNNVLINFNDIFTEEQKAVLLKFELLKPFDIETQFKCNLTYDDVSQTLSKIKEEVIVGIRSTTNENDFKLGMNLHVIENIAFFLSNLMYEAALKEVDYRNFDKAKEIISEAKSYLEVQLSVVVNSERLRKSLDNLIAYENSFENMKIMNQQDYVMSQKGSKYMSYMSRHRK